MAYFSPSCAYRFTSPPFGLPTVFAFIIERLVGHWIVEDIAYNSMRFWVQACY
jgi:hypothetical protein